MRDARRTAFLGLGLAALLAVTGWRVDARAATMQQPVSSPSASPSASSAPTTTIGVVVAEYLGRVVVLTAVGAAGVAGIKRGDVIASIDGTPVTTVSAFVAKVRAHAAGDHVAIVVERGGSSATFDVVAQARSTLGAVMIPSTIGVVFATRNGPPAVAHIFEKFPAEAAGLQQGDIIESVDGAPVQSGQAAHDAIGAHRPGEHVSLVVMRDGVEKNVDVTTVVEPPSFPVSLEDIPAVSGGGLTATRSTDARMIPPPASDSPIVVLDTFQPVALTQMGAGYYGLSIENASRKTVTHILFLIEMLSPFATILESHAFVLSGEFSPGILIEANGSRGNPIMDATESTSFNTNRPWFQINNRHGPMFNRWVVRVVKVAFSDGDVWQASGSYPIIMPPPVAASTTTSATTGEVGIGFSLESLCSTPRC